MKARRIFLAAVLLLLGAVAGTVTARIAANRHPETHAVMVLAQLHLQKLRAAAAAGNCSGFLAERQRLAGVHQEMLQIFPLAYAQDAGFRQHADALQTALQDAADTRCADTPAAAKRVNDSCDDCHREYR